MGPGPCRQGGNLIGDPHNHIRDKVQNSLPGRLQIRHLPEHPGDHTDRREGAVNGISHASFRRASHHHQQPIPGTDKGEKGVVIKFHGRRQISPGEKDPFPFSLGTSGRDAEDPLHASRRNTQKTVFISGQILLRSHAQTADVPGRAYGICVDSRQMLCVKRAVPDGITHRFPKSLHLITKQSLRREFLPRDPQSGRNPWVCRCSHILPPLKAILIHRRQIFCAQGNDLPLSVHMKTAALKTLCIQVHGVLKGHGRQSERL